jgi:hypothetical protein
MVPDPEPMVADCGSRRVLLRGSPELSNRREVRGLGTRRARGHGRRLAAVTSALAALFGCPLGGAAAGETDLYVALRYAIDAEARGCWDESEFRRSVTHRIGYDPFREDASIKVQVHVGGAANAVDGHVEWRKASGLLMGERRFVAKDGNCAKLLTEMSFAVGLQIELLRPKAPASTGAVSSARSATAGPSPVPATVAAPPAPAIPSPTPAAPSPPSPAAATPPPVSPPPSPAEPDVAEDLAAQTRPREKKAEEVEPAPADSSPRWPMWVGLGPSLAWRISPGLTADARLFLGIRRNDLSLEIGAEASYPSTERRWDGSGFRQSLIGGTLALCGHHEWLSGCLLGRASEVRAAGLGVDQPRSPIGFVAQAGLRLAATLELGGPWFATAHLDGLGLLTPCRVKLNQAVVWEMPRLAALAGIDLSVRFR